MREPQRYIRIFGQVPADRHGESRNPVCRTDESSLLLLGRSIEAKAAALACKLLRWQSSDGDALMEVTCCHWVVVQGRLPLSLATGRRIAFRAHDRVPS
jgi:hypothetical protein